MNYSRPTLLAAALLLALAPAVARAQGTLQGNWELTLDTPQGKNTVSLSLRQQGDKLTGDLSSQMGTVPVTGTGANGVMDITAEINIQGASLQLGVNGKAEGDSLNGTVRFGDFGEFPFTGKRAEAAAAVPSGAAPAPVPAPATPSTGAAAATGTGVAGKWQMVLAIPGVGEFPASATFTQDGAGIVGGVLNSPAGEVAVSGTMTGTALKLDFKASTPQGDIPVTMTGDLTGAGLSGKATIVGLGEANWTATRVP